MLIELRWRGNHFSRLLGVVQLWQLIGTGLQFALQGCSPGVQVARARLQLRGATDQLLSTIGQSLPLAAEGG